MAKEARAQDRQAKHRALHGAANMVIMAEHQAFARSFNALFAEGMALADKASAYFGGRAFGDCRRPPAEKEPRAPSAAALYERKRKELSVAVMQMAAWLWLERALREGDMSAEAAAREKRKLQFAALPPLAAAEAESSAEGGKAAEAEARHYAALPLGFCSLYAEVSHFIERIQFMDKEAGVFPYGLRQKAENSVGRQWQALRRAFAGKRRLGG